MRASRWWWVEDDKEVIVFTGTEAECRSYYRRRKAPDGGDLHLIYARKDQRDTGGHLTDAPVVGEVWDNVIII